MNNTEEDFWKRVKKTSTCWLWTGCRRNNGYGAISFRGKVWETHRLSYFLQYGTIPKHLFVCHHCDIKYCCKPQHLFLATHKENMSDAAKKGRFASGLLNGTKTHPERLRRGEKHGNAKLTWKQVNTIRKISSQSYGQQILLAKRFNVSFSLISAIVRNIIWKSH